MAGEDWRDKIRHAITDGALVFIACFSLQSLARSKSYWSEELVLAIEQLRLRRPDLPWLIPVRLEQCNIPDFDLGAGRTLSSLQRIDLFGEQFNDAGLRLVATVQRVLDRQSNPLPSLGRPSSEPSARRICIALDVADYAKRKFSQQVSMQRALGAVVSQACRSAVSEQAEWDYQSAGDGLLVISPPHIPTSEALRTFVVSLLNEILLANRERKPEDRIRIRAAITYGLVDNTKVGLVGTPVVTAARLLDSTALADALSRNPESDLAVILAEDCYRDAFAHAGYGFSPQEFHYVQAADPRRAFSQDAWLYMPKTQHDHTDGPLFFMSYTHLRGSRRLSSHDPNREVEEFFDDLTRNVSAMVAWNRGVELGFMDSSIDGGGRRTDELVRHSNAHSWGRVPLGGRHGDSALAMAVCAVASSARLGPRMDCCVPARWLPAGCSRHERPGMLVNNARVPGDLTHAVYCDA